MLSNRSCLPEYFGLAFGGQKFTHNHTALANVILDGVLQATDYLLTIRNTNPILGDEPQITKEVLTPTEPTKGSFFEQAIALIEKKEWNQAKTALQRAIEDGQQEAHVELARLYLKGNGVEKNSDAAVDHLIQAVEGGIGGAHTLLGLIHYHGLGDIPVDHSAAVHHFREGIQMGNDDSKAHFGWMLIQGHGVPEKDFEKGLSLLKEAENSPESLCYQGLLNLEGTGKTPTDTIAFSFFSRGAEKGHLESKFHLAYMHLHGKGAPKSAWDAAKLFTQAAERGHSLAQCHIGMMCRDGIGVKANAASAKSWFEKSAEQGDTLGCYCLAKMLLDDPDCDWLDVLDLFTKASMNGNVRGENYSQIYVDSLAKVFDGYGS